MSADKMRDAAALTNFALLHADAVAEIARLTQEVAHWKANHTDMVKRCAFLSERPDLPVDRIPAFERLTQELKSSQNIILAMANDLGAIHDELGLDPDDAAGAPPILEAIEALKAVPVQPDLRQTQAETVAPVHAQGVLTDEQIVKVACTYTSGDGPKYEFTELELFDFARALLAAQAPASDALDAARYRFLRTRVNTLPFMIGNLPLDESIDAVIAALKEANDG